MVYIAVPAELFIGLALLLGFATRYAVLVALFFMLVASFSAHAYWSVPEAQRGNQTAHFWKNISIMAFSRPKPARRMAAPSMACQIIHLQLQIFGRAQ
jgi:uncharacterized membrane protein YphA (DoxX/SURF4 family)